MRNKMLFLELENNNVDFGLKKGELKVLNYNKYWKKIYKYEEKNLNEITGNKYNFLHIGSTSVENMISKPIIDILMYIDNFEYFDSEISKLKESGYIYKGENGIKRRHYFIKGDPCFFHLHVMEKNSKQAKEWIDFRDRLRNDKEFFDKYYNLKVEIIEKKLSRAQYQELKSEFIKEHNT